MSQEKKSTYYFHLLVILYNNV